MQLFVHVSLSNVSLWAGRDLYPATSAVTQPGPQFFFGPLLLGASNNMQSDAESLL